MEREIASDGQSAGRSHRARNEKTAGVDARTPTVPLPSSAAPLFTVVRLDDAIEPFTIKAPHSQWWRRYRCCWP